jgi:TM2 domain-containing membrane protein YozV
MMVDFEADGNQAKAVYTVIGAASSSSKNKTAAGLLAIFLGGLGIHKFYLGYTGPGLVYLLVNTIGFLVTWVLLFTPNIVLGIIAFVEGIIYLTKTDEEFEQTYVVNRKSWF